MGYVDDDQDVLLNDEHSEYEWLTMNEAIAKVSLPGNDEVHEWLRVEM